MGASEIEDVAGRVTASIGRPIRGAALFYALYYLLEVEGFEAAAFDFQQLVDEYHEAFYWYGVFSAINEASNVYDRYLYDGTIVSEFHTESTSRLLTSPPDHPGGRGVDKQRAREDLVPHAESLVDPVAVRELGYDPDEIEDLAARLFVDARALSQASVVAEPGGRSGVVDVLATAAEVWPSLLDDPDRVVATIGQVFHNSHTWRAFVADQPTPEGWTDAEIDDLDSNARMEVFRANGWLSNQWNGPGWAGITDHLLRRDELSKTAWVDQSWSIEHNNNNWIDKVRLADRERIVVADLAPAAFSSAPANPIVFNALDGLLDAAQDGDMEWVFDYAVNYSREIGLNLRRVRRRLNL